MADSEPAAVNGNVQAPKVRQIIVCRLWRFQRGPNSFLKEAVGQAVIVRLNSGVDYRGVLSCLDGYMNIAMENTEELVNGVVKQNFGDAFIRGNNVLYIARL